VAQAFSLRTADVQNKGAIFYKNAGGNACVSHVARTSVREGIIQNVQKVFRKTRVFQPGSE